MQLQSNINLINFNILDYGKVHKVTVFRCHTPLPEPYFWSHASKSELHKGHSRSHEKYSFVGTKCLQNGRWGISI
jgi:hypothetical protein